MGAPLDLSKGRIEKREGAEFRGAFQDFTLWVEVGYTRVPQCERFHRHHKGNDGLWVVEYDTEKLMLEELGRIQLEKLDVPILKTHKLSIVVGGGERTADLLGYDACGMEKDKRFISVSSTDVRGPQKMPAATKARYMELAKQKRPAVEELLRLVDETSLLAVIERLQDYETRNSFSGANGLDPAAEWAAEMFEGYGLDVQRDQFREDMTPQIVAEFRGLEDPDAIVVVGAHFDSRSTMNSSPTQRAPGADDNGSGSAAVLELARIIQESGATFRHTLRLCLFTGEEQGLIGSRALASRYAGAGENIIGMFNTDMIGYKPPEATVTLAYMNRNADPDLTEISMAITGTYVPELQVALTNVCCSDQQSFYENGFPAVGFFETPNPSVVYPQYHQSNDLLEFLNAEQIYLQAKAIMASVLVYTEIVE